MPFSQKLLPTLALVAPTAVSIFLIATRNDLWGGTFRNFVSNSRSAVQIIVQVASLTLAMLQVYTLSKLFTLAVRLQLSGERISLNRLSLLTAISHARIDANLPTRYLVVLVSLVAITTYPLHYGRAP
jgi:hypothetical protein